MSDKPKVSRSDLIQILRKWESNQLSEQEIVDWADQYFPGEIEFEDWEGNDDQSVSNEIMAAFDSLGMNLIIKEDIPIYIEFLKTPVGEFEKGYSIWRDQLSTIDIENRMTLLKENSVYADFCK